MKKTRLFRSTTIFCSLLLVLSLLAHRLAVMQKTKTLDCLKSKLCGRRVEKNFLASHNPKLSSIRAEQEATTSTRQYRHVLKQFFFSSRLTSGY